MWNKGCNPEDRKTAREGPHRPKLEVRRIEREIQYCLNRQSKPIPGHRTSTNAETPAPPTAVPLYQPPKKPSTGFCRIFANFFDGRGSVNCAQKATMLRS